MEGRDNFQPLLSRPRPARIKVQNGQDWDLPYSTNRFPSSLSLPNGSKEHHLPLEILGELMSLNP